MIRKNGSSALPGNGRPAGEAGASLVEVLIAGAFVGIVIIGIALMFSWGQTFVVAQGDDRIALYLAQQKIERLRGTGYAALQAGDQTLVSGCPGAEPCYTESGIQAGAQGQQTFTRETVVECLNPAWNVVTPCPASDPTLFKRITATVTPSLKQANAVTLESFCGLQIC